MGSLTALQVKNAKQGRYADGGGLYLLVKPSGAKSWVLRVQVDGKRRDFGLGSIDLVGMHDAREKALAGRKLAKAGLDPSMEWKKVRRKVPTFAEAARELHETNKVAWKNGKHQAQWITTLEKYAFPMLGNMSVDQIDSNEIFSVLQPIWLKVPETARRVRQRIGAVLDYSKAQNWRSLEAPMRAVNSLMKGIRQPQRGHFSAMPYADVPTFLNRLEAASTTGGLALRFAILTAVRSGEVRKATWAEFDLEGKLWNIPAERMKMAKPHTVPLSEAAISILSEMASLVEAKPEAFVFQGLRRNSLSDMTLSKALRSYGGVGYTVHGFRSSFRDWVAEQTRFPETWAEAALAHVVRNKTEAAYRRTTFVEQRKAMMDEWAAYLTDRKNRSIIDN